MKNHNRWRHIDNKSISQTTTYLKPFNQPPSTKFFDRTWTFSFFYITLVLTVFVSILLVMVLVVFIQFQIDSYTRPLNVMAFCALYHTRTHHFHLYSTPFIPISCVFLSPYPFVSFALSICMYMVLFMHRSDNNANPFYMLKLEILHLYFHSSSRILGNVIQSMYLLVACIVLALIENMPDFKPIIKHIRQIPK